MGIGKIFCDMQKSGAKIVVSIWGHSVDDYSQAAKMLVRVRDQVAAIEVNLSCPNLSGDHAIFSHDAELSAQVVES